MSSHVVRTRRTATEDHEVVLIFGREAGTITREYLGEPRMDATGMWGKRWNWFWVPRTLSGQVIDPYCKSRSAALALFALAFESQPE